MFNRSKNYDQDIIDMKKRIMDSELEIEKMKSHIISLRGLMNRKLGETKSEDLKESVLIPNDNGI